MDHQTAEQIQAADRYLLGALSADERESFEEHFFTCPACAEEVRVAVLFEANARAVFEELQRQGDPIEAKQPWGWLSWRAASGWLDWLSWRPPMAVSWAAACLFLIAFGYQTFLVVPGLRTQLAEATAPQAFQSFALRSVSRGDELVLEVPRASRFVGLSLYLDPQYKFRAYRAEFRSAAGLSQFSVSRLAPNAAGDGLEFLIPASGLPSDNYTMVLRGLDSVSQKDSGTAIGTYQFVVKRK